MDALANLSIEDIQTLSLEEVLNKYNEEHNTDCKTINDMYVVGCSQEEIMAMLIESFINLHKKNVIGFDEKSAETMKQFMLSSVEILSKMPEENLKNIITNTDQKSTLKEASQKLDPVILKEVINNTNLF